jgi:hypothetical protein
MSNLMLTRLIAWKLAHLVLRGGSGGNVASLPDNIIRLCPRRIETCRHFSVAPISPMRTINASEEARCGLPHAGGNGVRDHERS